VTRNISDEESGGFLDKYNISCILLFSKMISVRVLFFLPF